VFTIVFFTATSANDANSRKQQQQQQQQQQPQSIDDQQSQREKQTSTDDQKQQQQQQSEPNPHRSLASAIEAWRERLAADDEQQQQQQQPQDIERRGNNNDDEDVEFIGEQDDDAEMSDGPTARADATAEQADQQKVFVFCILDFVAFFVLTFFVLVDCS
jgi:DNA mismatch repair ATPase MutL